MNLGDSLARMILDRITRKMDLQDSIAFSTFYNENDVRNGSEEFYVFQSEHYRREIFNIAERLIKGEGYNCRIDVDDSSRTKKIVYDAVVIHPLKKILKVFLYVSPIFLTYGTMMLSDYINRRNDEQKI